MSAPPPSPPRRPPLGPFANRRGEPTTSKPAPGKENIRPRPRLFTFGVRATTTTPHAGIRSHQQARSPVRTATSTATPVHSNSITADTDTETEAPESAIQPVALPPWRQPGAFESDESDEEEEGIYGTGTKAVEQAGAASVIENGKDDDNAGSPTVEQISTTASRPGDLVPPLQPVDDDADKENEFEQELSVDLASLGMGRRELDSTAVDLDADPELDYGDEFHDIPL